MKQLCLKPLVLKQCSYLGRLHFSCKVGLGKLGAFNLLLFRDSVHFVVRLGELGSKHALEVT